MHAILVWVAFSTIGINVGWENLNGGGMEYVIHIPPDELETFARDPNGYSSYVPPQLKDIRQYRIVVTNALPRRENPIQAKKPSEPAQTPKFEVLNQNQSRESRPRWPKPDNTSAGPQSPSKPKPVAEKKAPEPPQEKPKTQATPQPVEEPKGVKAEAKDEAPPSKSLWNSMPVVVGLVCSLAANLYLGWIALELRARYRSLLRRRHKPARTPEEQPNETSPIDPNEPPEIEQFR